MAVVPPLSFAALHQPSNAAAVPLLSFSALHHHAAPAVLAAHAVVDNAPVCFGEVEQDICAASYGGNAGTSASARASARTRARAKLRAQARQRRRDGPETARELAAAGGSSTCRALASSRFSQDTIREGDESEGSSDTGDQNPTARSRMKGASEAPNTARGTARGDGRSAVTDDSDGEASDASAAERGIVKSRPLLRCGPRIPWEEPLTMREKKARLLLLFEREKSMADRNARSSGKQTTSLQAQLDSLHEDNVRLRRERGDLRELVQRYGTEMQNKTDLIQKSAAEMQALRHENKRFKEMAGELQLRLHLMERERDEANAAANHNIVDYSRAMQQMHCQVMPEVSCQAVPTTCRGYAMPIYCTQECQPVYCMQPGM